jgi:conjugal transfer pilus assembly protein TrbC
VPAPINRIAALALTAIAHASTFAQTPTWPTQTDIDRALQSHRFPTPEQLRRQPIPEPPRIEAQRPGLDIDALARGHAPLLAPNRLPSTHTGSLRIFVTLDMPRVSLERLTDQAARTGAVLVLRGLKAHSMRQTLDAVQSLIGERHVHWTIDPEAFTRYGVQHAPTFVLTLAPPPDSQGSCTTQCPISTSYTKVAGDVSTDYALESMMRRHPQVTAQATSLLQRLRSAR